MNGLCYLATFVFAINSVGLFLYSGQLALNSRMGDSSSQNSKIRDDNDNTMRTDSSEKGRSSDDKK